MPMQKYRSDLVYVEARVRCVGIHQLLSEARDQVVDGKGLRIMSRAADLLQSCEHVQDRTCSESFR